MAPDPDTATRPIRVGVVGTGFAASSHLDALSRVGGVQVVGLVGRSEASGREAAARLGVPRAYPDLDALLAGDVAGVDNCTPNHVHAEVTLAALDAGKHVLSEKPLGIDAAEADRLAAAARRSQLVAGVCFNYRHFPLVQEVRAIIAEGADGPVHQVHGGYLQDWLLHRDDWNWRLESAKAGATRAVGDIGSHLIDTVQHVTGDRIVEVVADFGRLHDERLRPAGATGTFAGPAADGVPFPVDTEDFASILLRFAGGAQGAFEVSQVSPGAKNRLTFRLDTAGASFAWDQEEPNRLAIGRRDRANEDLVRDPSLLHPGPAALAHYPGGHQEG